MRKETVLDRRQKKTRRAIYEAFEELMAQGHYRSVTVAQIIDRADIGRSTFYAHFETKDDLLAEMCREMFDHIFEGVNEYCVTHPTLVTENLCGKLAHLLFHLRDTHSGVCGKLIRDGEPHFTRCFEWRLAILFERDGSGVREGVPHDLAIALQVSAFISAVVWWMNDDARTAPEQLATWYLSWSAGAADELPDVRME